MTEGGLELKVAFEMRVGNESNQRGSITWVFLLLLYERHLSTV
jgi:hypothetical protein